MLILAIDTTAVTAAVALTENDILRAQFQLNKTLTHSETLLPMVKALLDTASVKPSDIDLFACSVGPGSFTGVRIGVSTIKGLAFNTNKPCVGVSTLDALAANLDKAAVNAIVCPVMDARRDQFYNALYRNGEKLTADRCISSAELSDELVMYNADIYFTGDGSDLAMTRIKLPRTHRAPELLRCQNGYSVAKTAWKLYNDNPTADYSDLTLSPVYLRPSQAERTHALG